MIQLDLKRDLAPIVRHLRKLGVNDDKEIGKILTKNPYILINGLSRFQEQTGTHNLTLVVVVVVVVVGVVVKLL